MNYAKAIRITRTIRGYSQKELAELINVNSSFISRIEDGTRQPSTATLQLIAKSLSISILLLMFLAKDKEDFSDDMISDGLATHLGKSLMAMIAEAN